MQMLSGSISRDYSCLCQLLLVEDVVVALHDVLEGQSRRDATVDDPGDGEDDDDDDGKDEAGGFPGGREAFHAFVGAPGQACWVGVVGGEAVEQQPAKSDQCEEHHHTWSNLVGTDVRFQLATFLPLLDQLICSLKSLYCNL